MEENRGTTACAQGARPVLPDVRSARRRGDSPRPQGTSAAWAFELLTTRDQVAALAREWPELERSMRMTNIFLSWDWIGCWLDHCDADLWFLAARRQESAQLAGVAPLMMIKRGPRGLARARVLQFAAKEHCPDHMDFLVRSDDEDTATALVEEIFRRRSDWHLLKLHSMNSSGALSRVLQRQFVDRIRSWGEEPSPYVALPDSWETYRATLTQNMRYNLGRYSRKLLKKHPDAGFRLAESSAETDRVMDALFGLHQDLQEQQGNRGAFASAESQGFHRAFAQRGLASGRLRLYYLTIGSQIIAVTYCFRYGDKVFFYNSGYARDRGYLSPGRLVMAHAIRSSIEEGASEFDFLRGAESYKHSWGIQPRHDCYAQISRSELTHAGVLAYRVAKRLKESVMDWQSGSS